MTILSKRIISIINFSLNLNTDLIQNKNLIPFPLLPYFYLCKFFRNLISFIFSFLLMFIYPDIFGNFWIFLILFYVILIVRKKKKQ